jgi:hypothetical protein
VDRQRPERGAGEILKSHQKLSGAPASDNGTLSRWKTYTNGSELPDVMEVTEGRRFIVFTGLRNMLA